jgi:5-methyltetrahydrofolate--homocysteine methyltransferase
MNLDFSPDRWARLHYNAARWWRHELGRPLLHVCVHGRDPGEPEPALAGKGFTSHYPLTVPAQDIVDRWAWDAGRVWHVADSFPTVWPNFGPGTAAAFLGLTLHNTPDTTWFMADHELPLDWLRLEPDWNNVWYRRVAEITRVAIERLGGQVQIGMADIGGNLDIVSSFRPSEQLLYDLVDSPDLVERVTWQAHHCWWAYYDALNRILQPRNPGYTAWAGIFSSDPYYMLQCDFCYMIGPAMFDRFVKPELAATCRRLTNPFYHLDGPGQLPLLDSLLTIPELKGVQWVPGAGNPGITHWPEVYQKIHRAGKLIQIFTSQDAAGIEALPIIADQIGSADGIVMIGGVNSADRPALDRLLQRYGAQ